MLSQSAFGGSSFGGPSLNNRGRGGKGFNGRGNSGGRGNREWRQGRYNDDRRGYGRKSSAVAYTSNRAVDLLVDSIALMALPREALATMINPAYRRDALSVYPGGTPMNDASAARQAAMLLGIAAGIAPLFDFQKIRLELPKNNEQDYVISTGASGTGSVTTSTRPPNGHLGISRNGDVLSYIVAIPASGKYTVGFSWADSAASTDVTPSDLANIFIRMETPVPYTQGQTTHYTTPCSFRVVSTFVSALNGNLASLAKIVNMIRTKRGPAVPSIPLAGGRVAPGAICALMAWIAAGADMQSATGIQATLVDYNWG